MGKVGQGMKQRKEKVSVTGVQTESAQESVAEVAGAAQTPDSLEADIFQNLENSATAETSENNEGTTEKDAKIEPETGAELAENSGFVAPENSSLESLLNSSKDATGRDGNGVPSIVGLGDGTITSQGEFVPEAPCAGKPMGDRDMKPIGDVRRSLFTNYQSKWNGYVREITAALEKDGEVSVAAVQEKIFADAIKAMEMHELMTLCTFDSPVGEREDGSYGVVVTIGEGYWNSVKEWAEADGLTAEEWLTNLVTSNIETYGMPAKGR